MEQCGICGSHKKICHACGAELHKRFDDFIVRAEVIYAIFMAWGYASSAEAVIKAQNWGTFPLLVISTFILIRFFFAPTRNLYTAALLAEKRKEWRWIVFIFDFPILIFHSFAYYTMCIAVAGGNENAYRFFQWLIILLSANIIWLISIAVRMRISSRHKHFWTFIKWCINNAVSIVLFYAAFSIFSGNAGAFFEFFITKKLPFVVNPSSLIYWAFFWIALINCCLDVILTASDYLGFDT